MPRRIDCIELETPLPAPEIIWAAEEVPDHREPWFVLIGEGSDAERTLNFLHELCPDVECATAVLCDAVQGEWHCPNRARSRRKAAADENTDS